MRRLLATAPAAVPDLEPTAEGGAVPTPRLQPWTPDGPGWQCQADGCANPAVAQWQRQAPNGVDYDAVFACATHAITTSLMTLLHQASCTAPPTCNCTPAPLPPNF